MIPWVAFCAIETFSPQGFLDCLMFHELMEKYGDDFGKGHTRQTLNLSPTFRNLTFFLCGNRPNTTGFYGDAAAERRSYNWARDVQLYWGAACRAYNTIHSCQYCVKLEFNGNKRIFTINILISTINQSTTGWYDESLYITVPYTGWVHESGHKVRRLDGIIQ